MSFGVPGAATAVVGKQRKVPNTIISNRGQNEGFECLITFFTFAVLQADASSARLGTASTRLPSQDAQVVPEIGLMLCHRAPQPARAASSV